MESKPTFLLIEDNLIDQLIIKQLFRKVLNIDQIVIANNGREGLQWINGNKKQQSLIILLDIQMPIMNGFEFLDEFDKLSTEIKKETHIYVLSSTLDSDEILRIKENNYVSGFLSKPFPIQEFKNIVNLES
ncbi:two-component system response regulator [Flavobacterium aquidurense]|jgi:CheY-like chemotaxis protein|uniref:response regulator n=1 Tax=Flavobacterium aquidurense TaxID=362413 RepID=UPI000923634A|nr:response regulator [Flavobacterium aquidurense]OXA68316.1 response regulator [Flavobacterium aquidurense]SHH80201.1 CheY chemotaxis protein or a CheY-like REC (receiver) domain [Flavobacterium frigidimaris]